MSASAANASTTTAVGLTTAEAAVRLARHGANELPQAKTRPWWKLVLEVLHEPMFLLLLSTAGIYVLLGDAREAVALLGAVLLIIGITFYQERKTERALGALRDLSSPRALVRRDGVPTRISGRDVVPGDLLLLHEGDRIAADSTLVSVAHLSVDESMLTGESVPVLKDVGTGDAGRVSSGTWVVSGQGSAIVTATGAATTLGRIGHSLATIEASRTHLEREVDRVVRILAVFGMAACGLVTLGHGLLRHSWLDGVLAGLTLAIAMIPEEFPVILTVFLALGAWRLSRQQMLARRLPAIETLGSATVLCVDKTGTLTLNRMDVAAVCGVGMPRVTVTPETTHLDERTQTLLRAAVLASSVQPVDPMEKAFVDLAARAKLGDVHAGLSHVRDYPLSTGRLALTHVWRDTTDETALRVAVKGAPEAVIDLCRLTPAARQTAIETVHSLAIQGLRVLGVARGTWTGQQLPSSQADFDLELLGFVALADPVRPGVPAAVAECREAHIRVVMITGDHPTTALNIARAIGLARTDQCLTGAEMALLSDDELRQVVVDLDVFARMLPEQKLRLVRALQRNGEVVAMTGDGVNDGPALKAADIGVAMGGRGTDVAREAAALVVVDDDFSSIVKAVRLGRRIYDNIQKATAYALAVHVPIAGMSLLPVLFGWPLIILPVHLIFLEIVTDPACSVVFEMEPEEEGIMRRRPRQPLARLFTASMVIRSVLQGLGALLAATGVLIFARAYGLAEGDVRTLTFSTLIVTTLVLALSDRSLRTSVWRQPSERNPAFRFLIVGAAILLATVVYVPFFRQVFHLARPHLNDWLLIGTAGLAALVWIELIKRLVPQRT
jgi:P-type Ca2+ transporter type 2C